MVREAYVWAAFIVIVIAVAAYFRFYYQPTLSMAVGMPPGPVSVYPYQELRIPIVINNTGAAGIYNMSFGLYTDGNISMVYKADIPAGKRATVYYNFTPTESGAYNISFVADPGRLYDISDRQFARSSIDVNVMQADRADPYSLINPAGMLGADQFNLSASGYEIATYLYNNFSADKLELTGSPLVNSFVYPMLDVYAKYIEHIAIAHAYYNGSYEASMWLQGYLLPSAFYEAAIGKNLNATMDGNLTVIEFGSGTSMCSWYSGGWIKSVVSVKGADCRLLAARSGSFSYTSPLYSKLGAASPQLLNYSGFYQNISYAGDISIANSSFVYRSLISGTNASNVCWGNIYSFNGVSYCGQFLQGVSNTVLLKYERITGAYNMSEWILANDSQLSSSADRAVSLLSGYNFTGKDVAFVSGYATANNTCYIDSHVRCGGESFSHNSLSFRITSTYGESMTLEGVKCFGVGSSPETKLSGTLAQGGSANISTPCYTGGNEITGGIIGSTLNLDLYYTVGNRTVISDGYAYIS